MRTARKLLVILFALLVAMLPGVGLVASATDVTIAAVHSDCCPKAEHCKQQAPSGDCGAGFTCALKCFSVTGMIAPAGGAEPVLQAGHVAVHAIDHLRSEGTLPPLPPPRV